MADIDAAPLPAPDPEPPARPGEFTAPSIGPIEVWPPVVLAPMAGVTNAPFRTLCRRYGAGIYVNQMITARALVEGHRKSLELAAFAPDESPRSIQLYGTDPYSIGEATRLLVDGLVDGIPVDHIDMNFGCPMKKVTRHGGGAALPWKREHYRKIVQAAVKNAGDVPVTVKFRVGIDDDAITFLDQRPVPPRPNLGEVLDGMVEHAELLCAWMGEEHGIRDFRKHTGWYLKGFPAGGEMRARLNRVGSLEEMRELIGSLDRETPFPDGGMRMVRGHSGSPKDVHLPEGWLDDRDDEVAMPKGAEQLVSGG
jgi:tRNA-dihydrouridine synthase